MLRVRQFAQDCTKDPWHRQKQFPSPSSHFHVLSFLINIQVSFLYAFVFSTVLLCHITSKAEILSSFDKNWNKSLGLFYASIEVCKDGRQRLLLWGTKHQQYENLVFFKHRIALGIRQKMINSCLSCICHSYFQNLWRISGIDDFPCDQEMWIKIGNLPPQTQRKKLWLSGKQDSCHSQDISYLTFLASKMTS